MAQRRLEAELTWIGVLLIESIPIVNCCLVFLSSENSILWLVLLCHPCRTGVEMWGGNNGFGWAVLLLLLQLTSAVLGMLLVVTFENVHVNEGGCSIHRCLFLTTLDGGMFHY